MDNKAKKIVDEHVRRYMRVKVRDKFGADYSLIEDLVDEYIDKYTLRELLLVLRVEIEKRRR